jgi:hypothetical protein
MKPIYIKILGDQFTTCEFVLYFTGDGQYIGVGYGDNGRFVFTHVNDYLSTCKEKGFFINPAMEIFNKVIKEISSNPGKELASFIPIEEMEIAIEFGWLTVEESRIGVFYNNDSNSSNSSESFIIRCDEENYNEENPVFLRLRERSKDNAQ